MKAVKLFIFFLGAALVLFSCKKEFSNKELVQFVKNPENGFLKEKIIDGLKVEVLHKPKAYILASRFKNKDVTPEMYNEALNDLGDMQYFDMRLSTVGKQWGDILNYKVANMQAQQDRIHYLSYGMQNDISIIDGLDTLKCKLYHFERSYDAAPFRSFLLGFASGNKVNLDKTFVLDAEPFKTGPIKIKFRKEDISKISSPKL